MEPIDQLRISLADDELASLLAVTGLTPTELSPVLELGGLPGSMEPACRTELVTAGMLQPDRPALTQLGHDVLSKLLRPQTRIGITAGTADWLATTVSVAAGDLTDHEALVSIGRDDEGWAIGWPQPAGELVGMLQDHFTGPALSSPMPFEHRLSANAYLALWGVLDHMLATQLQATLDRVPPLGFGIRADDIWSQLVEGRTSGNLAWQVTVTRVLFPELKLDLDQAEMEVGLKGLLEQGLLFLDDDGGYLPAESLLALVEGLVPVFRFGSARTDRFVERDIIATTQVAIRAGLGAIILEEMIGDVVLVRSVGSLELEDLILNFRFPEEAADPADASVSPEVGGTPFCAQCGTRARPDATFCVSCGARVATVGES
jgi:hypothetical protein